MLHGKVQLDLNMILEGYDDESKSVKRPLIRNVGQVRGEEGPGTYDNKVHDIVVDLQLLERS